MKELLGLNPRPRIAAICAGAGWTLAKMLMETPGASEYLVGVQLPYAARATNELLGFALDKHVSAMAAKHMAIEAYMQATLHANCNERPIGLGMTASIASLREHRGAHECFYSIVTDDTEFDGHHLFVKDVGAEARFHNDAECSELASEWLTAIATGACVGCYAGPAKGLDALMAKPCFAWGCRTNGPADEAILFPGAFDPLHIGHEAAAAEVERTTHRSVTYCIAIDTPHKAPLTFQQMARRAAYIRHRGGTVLFTEGDPLYIDKARRRPHGGFIIGADAALRMLDPKWGVATSALVEEFQALGTRFHVAPRIVEGRELNVLDVEAALLDQRLGCYAGMFRAVHVVASATSSSAIRAGKESP